MQRMDYSGRQKKLQQTLDEQDLDGFVVTHPANLRYLCGYTGSNGLLLFLAGRKIFFTDGRYTLQAREEVKGARVLIAKGALIKDAAKSIGKLSAAAIGFEADLTTVTAAAQMRELVHRSASSGRRRLGLVMRQRMIKDAEELKLIRAAVKLGAQVYEEALQGDPSGSRARPRSQAKLEYRGAAGGRGRNVVRDDRRRQASVERCRMGEQPLRPSRGADTWSSIRVLYCGAIVPT